MGRKRVARRRRGRRTSRPSFLKETVMRGDGRYFVFYWFGGKGKGA